jgi:predicted Zn-dependent protease
MATAAKSAPPQFISTHPSGPTRIQDIQRNLPKVEPLYARAPKPAQRFDPVR